MEAVKNRAEGAVARIDAGIGVVRCIPAWMLDPAVERMRIGPAFVAPGALADLRRLLELCGLVGARVVDADGTYDPCRPNDRLLLGMKGTISEFELGILRARLKEAQWDKARRGELRIGVPIGYVWDYRGTPAFHPDSRVQEFIRLVFRKFRELGSGRQVFLWLRKEGHCSPRSDERHGLDFEWRPVRWRSVMSLLKNPFYAGAHAYGKTSTKTKVVDGRPRKSYGHEEPMDRWDVLIPNHHEGYITWEEFVQNQEIGYVRHSTSGGASPGLLSVESSAYPSLIKGAGLAEIRPQREFEFRGKPGEILVRQRRLGRLAHRPTSWTHHEPGER